MIDQTPEGRRAFILANTRPQTPPHTPELTLHLADEITPIWRMTEEALEKIGLPPPFWAFAWAGGQALARHLLDHPETVAGKRVVDVASGSGLVAIAAMKAGATSARAVDIDAFAEDACRLNAAANGIIVEASVADIVGTLIDADVLLAGDVFYEREMAARMLAWMEELAGAGVDCLVGDPGRTYLPRDRLALLSEHRVPVTRDLEDMEIKRTCVYRLAPLPPGG